MPRESFQVRLTRVMLAGKLTVADLANWLNRPHATVRLWVKGETSPSGRFQADLVYSRLLLLEQCVREGSWSVPEMSAHQRPDWIRRARDAAQYGHKLPTRDIA